MWSDGGRGYRRRRSCRNVTNGRENESFEAGHKRNPVNPKEFPGTKCLKDDRSERPEVALTTERPGRRSRDRADGTGV